MMGEACLMSITPPVIFPILFAQATPKRSRLLWTEPIHHVDEELWSTQSLLQAKYFLFKSN